MQGADSGKTYQIIRLNTPSITIGGKALKKGDTFSGSSNIKWIDDTQAMEVKDTETGSLYKFSKKVFNTKGAILSVADFFLKTSKASYRDTETGISLKKSPNSNEFPERRLALVMGNSNYSNLPYLKNAQKDATDIAETLLGLGFDVVEAYETNYEEMKTALNRVSSLAGNYDMVLFYFAGHGLQEDGVNYIIPINAELEFKSELGRMLNCDDIEQRLQASESANKLIIIDACRNIKKSWTRDSESGLARMEGGPGTVIFFSTQSGKTACDGEDDNSPFAKAILDNLPKASPSFPETINRIVKETYELTDHRQYPLIIGTFLSDFNFSNLKSGTADMFDGITTNIGTRSIKENFISKGSTKEDVHSEYSSISTKDHDITKIIVSNPYIKVNLYDIYQDGDNLIISIGLRNTGYQTISPRVVKEIKEPDTDYTTMAMSSDGKTYQGADEISIGCNGKDAEKPFTLSPNITKRLDISLVGFNPDSHPDFLNICLEDFDNRNSNGSGYITISNFQISQ